jgi:drug/metabolite transporter (DMT)-like permease
MGVPSPGDIRPDRSTLLAFVGVVLFGGLNSIGVRQTVHELAPFWGATIRFGMAGVIMAVVAVATRRSFPRGRGLIGAMLYGAVGIAGFYAFLYQGLRETSAGTAQVLVALAPLFTFFLAIAHGQERFRPQGLAGALIALAGVAIIFADRVSANVPIGSMALLVLGAVCTAEAGVIIKWTPRSDPFATNAVGMLTGTALLFLLSVLVGEPLAMPAQPATLIAIAYLIVFGSVGMFGLYVYALRRWTASAVSYMALLLPLVTVTAAAILTGERVTPSFLAGGAVILAGVYVGTFLKLRRTRPVPAGLPECVAADIQMSVIAVPAATESGTA